MTADEYSTLVQQQMDAAIRGDAAEFERLSDLHRAYLDECGALVDRVAQG